MDKNHWKILLIGLLLGNDPGCNCRENSLVQNDPSPTPVSIQDPTDKELSEKKPQPTTFSGRSNELQEKVIQNQDGFQKEKQLSPKRNTLHHFQGVPGFPKNALPCAPVPEGDQIKKKFNEFLQSSDQNGQNDVKSIVELVKSQNAFLSKPLSSVNQLSYQMIKAVINAHPQVGSQFLAWLASKDVYTLKDLLQERKNYGKLGNKDQFSEIELIFVKKYFHDHQGLNDDILKILTIENLCASIIESAIEKRNEENIKEFTQEIKKIIQKKPSLFNRVSPLLICYQLSQGKFDTAFWSTLFEKSTSLKDSCRQEHLFFSGTPICALYKIDNKNRYSITVTECAAFYGNLEAVQFFMERLELEEFSEELQKRSEGRVDPLKDLIIIAICANQVEVSHYLLSHCKLGNQIFIGSNHQLEWVTQMSISVFHLMNKIMKASDIDGLDSEIENNILSWNTQFQGKISLFYKKVGKSVFNLFRWVEEDDHHRRAAKRLAHRLKSLYSYIHKNRHHSNSLIETINCVYVKLIMEVLRNAFNLAYNRTLPENLVGFISHLLDHIGQSSKIKNFQELEEGILKFVERKLEKEEFREILHNFLLSYPFKFSQDNILKSLIINGTSYLKAHFFQELKKNPENTISIEAQRIALCYLLIFIDNPGLNFGSKAKDIGSKAKDNCKLFLNKLLTQEKPSEIFEDFHANQEIIKESGLEGYLNSFLEVHLNLFVESLEFHFDGSLKTTLAQISDPELQKEFLSSIFENGHFGLLSELWEQKNFKGRKKLLEIWSTWAREDDHMQGLTLSSVAERILHSKSLDQSSLEELSQMEEWKKAFQIYQSIEALMNSELNKDHLGKIQGEDQFFDELSSIQQPDWNSLREKLFALLEYSLFGIQDAAKNRGKKIERFRILSRHLMKNALINDQSSTVLKPLFEFIKINAQLMQKGLFLVLNQYRVNHQNRDWNSLEKKTFLELYSICYKEYEVSLDFDTTLPNLVAWRIQKGENFLENKKEKIQPIDQEQEDRIDAFLFYFVQQDYIGHHFLGEFIGETIEEMVDDLDLSRLLRIEFNRILDEQYFEKQKDGNKDFSKWLKETEKKILELKNIHKNDQKDSQNQAIESEWEKIRQGILLKKKIYAVRPGKKDDPRFQVRQDLAEQLNLMIKLKGILGRAINRKDLDNDLFCYFAKIMQNNPDLEKFFPDFSEMISLNEIQSIWKAL